MCLHLTSTQMPSMGEIAPQKFSQSSSGQGVGLEISLWALFPPFPALAVPSKAPEPAAPQVPGASPLWLVSTT